MSPNPPQFGLCVEFLISQPREDAQLGKSPLEYNSGLSFYKERFMMKLLIPMLMIAIFASIAQAGAIAGGSFDVDGTLPHLNRESNGVADRVGLIASGQFEDGDCSAGSAWSCSTVPNDCPIIVDLFALGLWNYDGDQVAWIGGLCNGIFDDAESICQDIHFDGDTLSWYWMAYVNIGSNPVQVTIDGVVVYEYMTRVIDHLVDYRLQEISIANFKGENHTLCFTYEKTQDLADNYFVDHVYLDAIVATEELSFSVVKTLY